MHSVVVRFSPTGPVIQVRGSSEQPWASIGRPTGPRHREPLGLGSLNSVALDPVSVFFLSSFGALPSLTSEHKSDAPDHFRIRGM